MQRQLSYHQMQQQIDKVYQHHYPNHVHKTVSRCYEGHRQNPRAYAVTYYYAGCLKKSQPRFTFYFHIVFFPSAIVFFLIHTTFILPCRGLACQQAENALNRKKRPGHIKCPRRFRKRNNKYYLTSVCFSEPDHQTAKCGKCQHKKAQKHVVRGGIACLRNFGVRPVRL